MAGKMKHKSRSRKTMRKRMMAARWYCNYSMTRQERLMMMGY